ncbi:unnamed protein product [Penicillium camemberti]|uniref:Str. FM013 n=1 Tax=Penicillium camemberti (strain FM 013) TaxID=1429867 RepID=A0A0G4PRR3_PENC3|nr:unnamed protein product [Penicillium camemberti]
MYLARGVHQGTPGYLFQLITPALWPYLYNLSYYGEAHPRSKEVQNSREMRLRSPSETRYPGNQNLWNGHSGDSRSNRYGGPLNPGEKNCGVPYSDVDQRLNGQEDFGTFVAQRLCP